MLKVKGKRQTSDRKKVKKWDMGKSGNGAPVWHPRELWQIAQCQRLISV